jgi:hypothetical protein
VTACAGADIAVVRHASEAAHSLCLCAETRQDRRSAGPVRAENLPARRKDAHQLAHQALRCISPNVETATS